MNKQASNEWLTKAWHNDGLFPIPNPFLFDTRLADGIGEFVKWYIKFYKMEN